MGRKKKNIAPGRKSDFMGEKAEWLESFKDDVSSAGPAVGKEYTNITNRFLLRYGYNLPFGDNVDGDPEDNPPVIDQDVDEEEKERHDKIRTTLRIKLAGWYRTRYRNKKIHNGALNKILGTMQSMVGPTQRPRRKPDVAVYSRLYCETKLKPDFDRIWATTKLTVPESSRVAMSQDFVRSRWIQETAEVKAEVAAEAEAIHTASIAAWKEKRSMLGQTAAEYHKAMEELDDVAIPLADALAERLGSHVVILVVGPYGGQGGEVRLRTVFSDTVDGQTSKTWAEFDHSGFSAMEASITRYGCSYFSKAQCRDRAWPPLAISDPTTEGGLLQIDKDVHFGPGPVSVKRGTSLSSDASSSLSSSNKPSTSDSSSLSVKPAVTSSASPKPAATSSASAKPAAMLSASPKPAVTLLSAKPAATSSLSSDGANPSSSVDPADGIDRSEWDPNFVEVYAYLSAKDWGPLWKTALAALVHYEWSHYFEDDISKFERIKKRPAEIALWQKKHRPITDFPLITDSQPFGERLLVWWQDLGPKGRWDDVVEMDAPVWTSVFGDGEWAAAEKFGRNGMQMFLMALAWWGQDISNRGAGDGLGGGEKAIAAAADWQRLLSDVGWFLGYGCRQRELEEAEHEGEEENGKEQKKEEIEKKARKQKRKAADTVAGEDDETARKTRARATSKARPKPKPLTKSAKKTATATAIAPVGRTGSAHADLASTPVNGPIGTEGNNVVTAHDIHDSVVTANSISNSLALASPLPPVPLQPPVVSSTLAGGNVSPASTPIISGPDALEISINIQHPGAETCVIQTTETAMDVDPPDPSNARMDVDPSDPLTSYPTDCDLFAKDPFAGLSAEDDPYVGLSAEELQEIQDDEHADSDEEH
ncbi:hypothetical protein B0H14DRAFT_3425876 [Mycena olivaceomarginata]|nr:hypothetical protein B0H14DRAFT_3425876 [Mycena olivaceomarginata]